MRIPIDITNNETSIVIKKSRFVILDEVGGTLYETDVVIERTMSGRSSERVIMTREMARKMIMEIIEGDTDVFNLADEEARIVKNNTLSEEKVEDAELDALLDAVAIPESVTLARGSAEELDETLDNLANQIVETQSDPRGDLNGLIRRGGLIRRARGAAEETN